MMLFRTNNANLTYGIKESTLNNDDAGEFYHHIYDDKYDKDLLDEKAAAAARIDEQRYMKVPSNSMKLVAFNDGTSEPLSSPDGDDECVDMQGVQILKK